MSFDFFVDAVHVLSYVHFPNCGLPFFTQDVFSVGLTVFSAIFLDGCRLQWG